MKKDIHHFDVIIPTYNNRKELAECLASLEKQTFRSFYVYVCVDGSTDDTLAWLERQSCRFDFEVLQHTDHANHGRPATRNLALRRVKAPFVVMLDSDVAAAPDFLEAHRQFLDKWGDISVGDIRFTNTGDNIWARYLQQRGKHRFDHEDVMPPTYFTTGNVAFPADVIPQAGLMDENITCYGGEDTDFGIRLVHHTGKSCRYNKKAVVYSVMDKSLETGLSQLEEFGGQVLPYLVKKYESIPDPPSIFKVHLAGKKWLCSPVWAFMSRILMYLPFTFAKFGIHYLVFYHVALGYKKGSGAAHTS